ncbi:CK1/CK1 protein kinase [Trametes cingulata]|nr:CK1/CK1 protein kinase [Trametes cingulata]
MAQQRQVHYPRYIGNYELHQKLGAGFSGAIFCARHVHTNQWVALKLQPVNEPCPTNKYERSFYPALQGGVGMPTLWGSGVEGKWDYLAIDLLGTSLDSLHRMKTTDVWDLRSVCCVAQQVISRLEFMHTRGVLHRDIQLGNCVLGLPPHNTTIYMIDFGFSKFYIDQRTRRHIPDSKAPRDFIGNYWFSSVRVHCRGQVPSRRDDMEAVALMLIHMLTPGGLHWTRNGVPKTDEAHQRLMYEKRTALPEDLCRGLPPPFEEFLRYCRRLQFAECPDYARWIDEFRELAEEHGFPGDPAFVWPPPNPEPTVRAQAAPPRKDSGELEGVLNGIANMQLGERPVLAVRDNLVNRDANTPPKDKDAAQKKPAAAAKPKKPSPKASKPKEVEVINLVSDDSDSEGAHQQPRDENAHARGGVRARATAGGRLPKAVRLAQIARAVPGAKGDGKALARLVREFVQAMEENRSRMLTKEGFAVLDALRAQLADPHNNNFGTKAAPLRTGRSRASIASEDGQSQGAEGASPRETRQGKLNKLWRLGQDVRKAGSREELAALVVEFGAVINRSSGRTVTKDAFGFLAGLAGRLEALAV